MDKNPVALLFPWTNGKDVQMLPGLEGVENQLFPMPSPAWGNPSWEYFYPTMVEMNVFPQPG